MAYQIITSADIVALASDVNTFLAANPTYNPIGEPVLVSVSECIQAVCEPAP
jgi:hypothetical protein